MPKDPSVKLTLSIWRDFVPTQPLAFSTSEQSRQVLDSDSGLQEQVYSWPLREDVFAGISNDDIRSDLHNRLVQKLADSKSPSERGLDVLLEFVEEAQKVIDAGEVRCLQAESRSDEHDRIEVNSLLALTTHLKWIIACFGDRPGISVSVR